MSKESKEAMAITINPTTCNPDDLARVLAHGTCSQRTTRPPRLRPARPLPTPLEVPFVIIVDVAEKAPFTFTDLHADAIKLYRPLVVRTIRRRLPLPVPHHRLSIDYSIEGHETTIGIERKSHEDFCNTLAGRHRRRFERKLSIINETFSYFVIMVEAHWGTILDDPPDFSVAVPRTLFRTYIAWDQRYPRVRWMFMPGRVRAEQATFRVLERWWREREKMKQVVVG